MNAPIPTLCLQCGKTLPAPSKFRAASYCSGACRVAAHRRKHQGKLCEPVGRWYTNLDALLDAVASGEQRPFGCIYADPPWKYGNSATRGNAHQHYPLMPTDDIVALPVGQLAAPRSHLWLWTTTTFRQDAVRVLEAWGFEYKSEVIWNKGTMGTGNYTRVQHEILLLGSRRTLTTLTGSLRSVVSIKRGKHSAKPEAFRSLIEKNSPAPRLELFARKRSPGWTLFGNQDRSADMHEFLKP